MILIIIFNKVVYVKFSICYLCKNWNKRED